MLARIVGNRAQQDHPRTPQTKSPVTSTSRGQYGTFKLNLERNIYYENDTICGSLTCDISKALACRVIIVRLRCVIKRMDGKTLYPTTTLYRAERVLTTRCTLQPPDERSLLDCDATYSFDFSFSLDPGFPNSTLCEYRDPYSKVAVEWYLASLCKTTDDEQILLAKQRFTKGAMYVPQLELQPRACQGKAFLFDRLLGKPDARLYVYASLDRNVYTCGTNLQVRVSVRNSASSVRVTRVKAKVKQYFRNVIGTDSFMLVSPSLARASVEGVAAKGPGHTYNLTLSPSVQCNCYALRSTPNIPECARIAHIPMESYLEDSTAMLAPSGYSKHRELGAQHLVRYEARIKVLVAGGRPVKLAIPFTLTNFTEAAVSQLSEFACSLLVSATPMVDNPPAYELIDSNSTALVGHLWDVLPPPAVDKNTLSKKGGSPMATDLFDDTACIDCIEV